MPRDSSAAAIGGSTGLSRKPWVPELVNSTAPPAPSSAASDRAVSSMKGERQMLAVHTKCTRSGRRCDGGLAVRASSVRRSTYPSAASAATTSSRASSIVRPVVSTRTSASWGSS